jgi:EAL domain-containing protein (putative c-di-GMP-specific phosphodiesterase class I)/GGDEF domain-containing protein
MQEEAIHELIAERALRTLFQPIVDGGTRTVLGYEALTRGLLAGLESPLTLIECARRHGLTLELERACLETALLAFHALRIEGRLFLNLLPQTLLEWSALADWLGSQLETHRIDPHEVVLEITEHGLAADETRLAAAVRPLRALGCDIAIDDLGAGSSGLKSWAEIRPDYVKVDRYFVSGIERDPVRAEVLRSLVDIGRVTGCRIVAEGIENREQCALVLELGVDYLQGYFLGRPGRIPRLEPHALAGLTAVSAAPAASCAEGLVLPIPAMPADSTVASVMESFRRHPEWTALAVVESSDSPRPIGLVYRDRLLIFLSRPLHPEIYNRKPVTSIMARDPVQVEARARLDQVSRIVTARAAPHPCDDFIISRSGVYLGLGRTVDLLRQITAQQIQAAMHSNPLTGLPGNQEIQTQLCRLVARRRHFVACHLDLDHFKPYNDEYGYARGDQVLLHVAQVITRAARRPVDFVGHVGGDDFILLLRSLDWPLRLAAMLEELTVSLVNFHAAEHRATGGFDGVDREGGRRRFPLLGVSIGAVEVDGAQAVSPERVLEGLRQMKSLAKSRGGSGCLLASSGRVEDLTRRAEVLGPVDELRIRPVDGEGDAHLAEARGHDVGAVMRAREPAGDGFPRRPDAARDVLAHEAPAVAGARHPLPRSAAAAAGMAEEVVRRHVP